MFSISCTLPRPADCASLVALIDGVRLVGEQTTDGRVALRIPAASADTAGAVVWKLRQGLGLDAESMNIAPPEAV
ncbi:MAG: hypothetical protein JWR63_1061 [Conexibacter sp.]|nr:hypothetical protein [Conexibacter sp.]